MNCEEIKRRNKYLMVAVGVLLIIILVLLFRGGSGHRSNNYLYRNNSPNLRGMRAHN